MRMRELRKSKGLTMKELGNLIGLAESTISLYETGKREPDLETLRKIADVFQVSIDYLLGLTDEPLTKDLDAQLSDVDFALSGELREMSDDEKQDILDYVRFKKSQKRGK